MWDVSVWVGVVGDRGSRRRIFLLNDPIAVRVSVDEIERRAVLDLWGR